MAHEADVARGTSVDATRHSGHVAEPQMAHARRRWRVDRTDTWQEATRVHADACEGRHVARGGWHVKGPRVSGPWLEYWGGNAIALNRPSFYTRDVHPFSSCGSKFPGDFLLQVTWQHHGRRIRSRGVDRMDPSPRDRNQ